MKRYTLKTIKKTKCYQANVEAVRAIYPGHEDDFARELMIAANAVRLFNAEGDLLVSLFKWNDSPQGHDAWETLYWAICKYNTEQTKND
jgi:hypothetical protein